MSVIQNRKLFITLFLLPIVSVLFLSWLFFIPLPLFDYWDVLHRSFFLPDSSFLGWISFFWAPFVDQKMIFPKLFIASMAHLMGNNHYGIEIAFGILGQLFVLGIICLLIARNQILNTNQKRILWLTSSLLLFWPNLLMRFQHHWYSTQYTFVLIFALASIFSAHCLWGNWRGVFISTLFAAFSALSHGTGLIFLLSFVLLIICLPDWSKSQKSSILAVCIGLVAVIVSQMPERDQLDLPPLNWFTDKPLQELIYIFRCFGPEGVLRTQTGFLAMFLGFFCCVILFTKKEFFSRENFPWILIYFWGGSVAFISAITRSSFTENPAGIYFSFFVIVLNAVFVLVFVTYNKISFDESKGRWKPLIIVFLILYCAGTVDGIRDAASTQKRILWSQERLNFFPLLNQHDYRWLYPTKRFKKIASDLHRIKLLEDVNIQPFSNRLNTNFTSTLDNGDIVYIPERPLSPDTVLTFSGKLFSTTPFVCYWTSDGEWATEQSQDLQPRRVKSRYWVFFRNREVSGFSENVVAIKLSPINQTDGKLLESISDPLVWSRAIAKK